MPVTRSQSKMNDYLAKWLYKNMCKYCLLCSNIQHFERICETDSFVEFIDTLRLMTEQMFIIGNYLPDILDSGSLSLSLSSSISIKERLALIYVAEGLYHVFTKMYKRVKESVNIDWKIYWRKFSNTNGFKKKSKQVDLSRDDINTIVSFLEVFEEQKKILESFIRIN